jgi:RimJ/RimL family protein N-acetyltransferase
MPEVPEAPDRLPDEVLARRERLPKKPANVVLTGALVELRPLDLSGDHNVLHAITNGQPFGLGTQRIEAYDAEERIWRYMSGGPFRDAADLRAWLAPQVAAPDALPLTVRDRSTGTPIGVACLMANHPEHLRIELGGIWYGAVAQGTGAAAEATYLMLGHAFGLGYRRVEWKCDSRNERSRRAARAYGFSFETIQDHHYIVKGKNRDTAWYRMLDNEWAAIAPRLRTYTFKRARERRFGADSGS